VKLLRTLWCPVLAGALATACATSLERGALPKPSVPARVAIERAGATHELGAQGSEELIERAAGEEGATASLERTIAAEKALTGSPLVAGNRARLLVDGPEAYAAMFDAIAHATHNVHLETYILDDDEIGLRLADHLIERRRHGVAVRVLYDGFGSRTTSDAYFERLRAAGVELRSFRPIDPIANPKLWKLNNRDHRKILVVDGRVAFTGGMNISKVYASSSFAAGRKPRTPPSTREGWRDTQLEIEGPAVAELQKLFLRQWNDLASGPEETCDGCFPALAPRGSDLVRIVASRGGDARYEIYHAYLAALERARSRVWVTQAYFVPDRRMLDDLEAAARRGVDVRVLVPGISDHSVVVDASRAYYEELLEAGVRIYERSDAVVHAKTAAIDGVWSTVGSSNLNYRSFVLDDEANAVVVSRHLGRQMERLYRLDLAHAREIDPEHWRSRSLGERVLQEASSVVVRAADWL